MNKELQQLEARYYELSRSFLVALQNDQSSEELEVIRHEIRDILRRMEELGSQEQSSAEGKPL